MKKRILITGATGNIGHEVIKALFRNDGEYQIIAGVRDIDKAQKAFSRFPNLDFVGFDFENTSTFDLALKDIDRIFLLRPPHISDVNKYFQPLIEKIKANGVHEVVFLSVQGAEKSKVIPHHKIERLIENSKMGFVFLRPSYFMQNLTTTLSKDIQYKRKIILPAGKARFNWVDAVNIGELAAHILLHFEKFKNQKIEITGLENLSFYEATEVINNVTNENIKYVNLNLISFFIHKKKESLPSGLILVMIMLHFLPRFQKEPAINHFYEEIFGKKPTSLRAFVEREKANFKSKT